MKQCKKTPYSKKEAKHQLHARNLSKGEDANRGSVYWCSQHRGYHISRAKYPIIHERVWDKIQPRRKKGFTKHKRSGTMKG